MRSFGALSLGFVVLFGLAVGLKIGLRGFNEEAPPDANVLITNAGVRHGFWSTPVERGDAQLDRIAVTRGQCSATITIASPLGIHRSAIRAAASLGERVYFVYRGRRYDEQPLWATVTDHYLRRIGRVFGPASPPHLLLGVAASAFCPSGALDWLETDV